MDSNNTTSTNDEVIVKKHKKGISGSTLKLIAIITMLIDHTAATIVNRMLQANSGMLNTSDAQAIQDFLNDNVMLISLNAIMRSIGRIAFPIFCFLLIEGFQHTRNRRNYGIRLAIFALISEIPFDLAFEGTIFEYGHQNVFFTLLIGLLVMEGFRMIKEKAEDKMWLPILGILGAIATGCAITYSFSGIISFINNFLAVTDFRINLSTRSMIIPGIVICMITLLIYWIMSKRSSLQKSSRCFADLLILIAGMTLAEVLNTDYSGFGVLTIAVMYGLRKIPFRSMLGGCITLTIMSSIEAVAFINLIFIRLYNGTRGLKLKYVFYLFYPVHLIILYLICYFMKIA